MKPEIKLKRLEETLIEINKWLEEHDGIFPNTKIYRDGKYLKKTEMTEQQKKEVELGSSWEWYSKTTDIKTLLEKYIKMDLTDIPEEYRGIVSELKKINLIIIENEKTTSLKEQTKKKRKRDINKVTSLKTQTEKKRKSNIKKIKRAVTWMGQNIGRFPKIRRNEEATEEIKKERSVYALLRNPIFREIENKYEETPLEEIPLEYREYIELYRKIPKKDNAFDEILKWLEENDGKMPESTKRVNGKRLKRGEMTPKQLEAAKLQQKWYLSDEKKILEQYVGVSLEEIPKKYRTYIAKMRKYGFGIQELQEEFSEDCFDEIVKWLEEHIEKLPRKEISNSKNDKNEEYEVNLRKRWDNSVEKTILKEYTGKPIEEVPEEYRERIAILRSNGLGLTKKDLENQFLKWIELNGRKPSDEIIRNGQRKKMHELTKEERIEVRLCKYWLKSELRNVLYQYKGKEIEEVPEEFRERIIALRKIGLDKKNKPFKCTDIFKEIINWLKTHNGKFHGKNIKDENGIKKKAENMTEEERYEIFLYQKWYKSKEREKIIEYKNTPLEEIPEEFRDKIKTFKEVINEFNNKDNYICQDLLLWSQNHSQMPRINIYYKGLKRKRDLLTEEELYEVRLAGRWKDSELKQILKEYEGKPLEEVPEEFRENVRIIREIINKFNEKDKDKNNVIFKEIELWLENHNKMPRDSIFYKKGVKKSRKTLTKEELYEVRLSQNWRRSEVCKVLNEYAGRPIEEVPEEYRDKIKFLREHGVLGKTLEERMKYTMKKAVGSQIATNQEIRKQLEENFKEKDK